MSEQKLREALRLKICDHCAMGFPYSDERKISHVLTKPYRGKYHRPCDAWYVLATFDEVTAALAASEPQQTERFDARAEAKKLARYIWQNVISLSSEPPKNVIAEVEHALLAAGRAASGGQGKLSIEQVQNALVHADEAAPPKGKNSTEWLTELLNAELAVPVPAQLSALCDALREVNSLQHEMAIELDKIPQQPRIEYWTRKIEKVCCDALLRSQRAETKEKP